MIHKENTNNTNTIFIAQLSLDLFATNINTKLSIHYLYWLSYAGLRVKVV